jgi:hypothetical protein
LLSRIEQLDDAGLRPDSVRQVASARVVYVNHDVVTHDFPATADAALIDAGLVPRGVAGADAHAALRAAREDWLLSQAGVVSSAQLVGSVANTPIETVGEPRLAWRPARYGRALAVPVYVPPREHQGLSIGLMDLKGVGVPPGAKASLEPHSSGLCSLREVLREVLFQSLIDEIFRRAAPAFWTLPVYGVIDLGVDVLTSAGDGVPAGVLVRRGHRRPPFNISLPLRGTPEQRTKLEIELLLRHYGLTSSNRGTQFRFEDSPKGRVVRYVMGTVTELAAQEQQTIDDWLRGAALPLTCDGVNIQLTREVDKTPTCRAQLLDFGQYEVRPHFEEPLVSLVYGELLRWGAALWPHDPDFVQPIPKLRVAPNRWGFGKWRANDPDRPRRFESEGASVLAQRLARDFRDGRLSGAQVRSAIYGFVAGSIAHWEHTAG